MAAWALTVLMVLTALSGVLVGGCSGPAEARRDLPALSESNRSLARGCLCAAEIRGQSLVTVQETVESVFTAAGLGVGKKSDAEWVFERPATRGERGAYGNWFGTDIRVRLRVEVIPQSGGIHFLRCRSFIARDSGASAEDEQPLARRHVRDYEGLLDEVSARLN